MANEGVHVVGLPELSRALKAADKEAYKQLRLAMKAIAQRVIGAAVGRGAPSGILKPSATQKGAGIAFPKGGPDSGKEKHGFYPWLDFGGGVPFGRGVTRSDQTSRHQKTDWTQVGYAGFRRPTTTTGGRYLYPAIDDARRSGFIENAAYEAIERAAKTNGFEVRS